MKVTLPADCASAITEVGGIAVLLDKNGWRAAAFIAVSCKPGTGGPSKLRTSPQLTFRQFAKELNAKGWSDKVIARHYEAWEAAAVDGLVEHSANLGYGERIEVPIEGWSNYYPPRWADDPEAQAVATEAKASGAGASKAVDISQNLPALTAAIKASPKAAAAATQALVDKGDIHSLSRATAAVAKNRQVERNRKRVAAGGTKARTVQDPKPAISSDPSVNAFLSVQGLSTALRALVDIFPKEWAALSDGVRQDEDFVGVCEESLDAIDMAVAACRALITGGEGADAELLAILEGGK